MQISLLRKYSAQHLLLALAYRSANHTSNTGAKVDTLSLGNDMIIVRNMMAEHDVK